jgi:Domain of unknown function (DUF5655)
MTDGSVLTSASPRAQHLYRGLLDVLRPLGSFQEEMKKTSVHLVRRSAFAGVRMRREHLIVTIKSERPITSARIAKVEQVSKNRWHNEIRVSTDADFDPELLTWLKGAYSLCA